MPTYIDLFAGCGGLSLGLKQAGWTGLFAVEKNPDAFATLRHNLIDNAPSDDLRYCWPDWLPIQPMAISTLTRRYRAKLKGLRGTVDLIAGGPPCQGFSTLGLRDSADRRNLLFREYLDVVALVRPKIVLLENVKGIMSRFSKGQFAKSKAVSEKICDGLVRLGYEAYPRLVSSEQLGVAQTRVRFFLIAIDRSRFTDIEADPFSDYQDERSKFLKSLGLSRASAPTVGDAISDLETDGAELVDCEDTPGFKQIKYRGPKTAYQKSLREFMRPTNTPNSLRLARHRRETVQRFVKISNICEPGRCITPDAAKRLNTLKRHVVLLDKSSPSVTVTTLPDDSVHYSEPRILTVRECARLQSFPDWYSFCGKYTTGGNRRKFECPRYTQVGNAVPPRVAHFFGLLLRNYLHRVEQGVRFVQAVG